MRAPGSWLVPTGDSVAPWFRAVGGGAGTQQMIFRLGFLSARACKRSSVSSVQ